LCLSLVLIVANNSSLNVNLPILQRALGSSNSGLQWLVDAYSLVFAGLLLPAGALADRYGRKTALQLGLVVVAAASLTAMFCSSTGQVIACRAVMGAGAAFIMPGTLSILTNVFPPKERGKAIAIWAGFAGFGGVLGPMASGYLLDHFYWGSAFAINLPIIAVALVAGLFLVPNSKDPADTILDPVGVLLVVSGLLLLLYGVIDGPETGWLATSILVSIIAGAALLVAFVGWELHTPDPMLDVRLFKNRDFAVGSGTITMQYFALYGLFFIFAQYLELSKGFAPLKAAVSMLPIGILMMVGAPMSARLVARFGPRLVVGSGLLCTAGGLLILSTAKPSTPVDVLILGQILIGFGIGQTTAPSTTLIISSVRMSKAGVGSAVNDVSRELGGALGIAVLGSILNSVYRGRIGARLPAGLPHQVVADAHRSVTDALLDLTSPKVHLNVHLVGPLVNAVKVTFASGFGLSMVGGAVMLVLCSLMVWIFQRRGAD
jgi:EmrB/QacA subfamily drug resistance transporter